MAFDTNRTINGSWGELKIDGQLVAEVTGLEAKVTIDKEEVKQCGTLAKGYKITGVDGKGTVKLNKVYSRMIELINDNLKAGKSTVCTIESTLKDPASDGQESVTLKNCIFDELTLADWESKKIGEESYAFTFTDWEVPETIATPTGA